MNLRPDVAIINSNLLPYAWYRQALRRTHANLLFLDETNRPLTTLSDFVKLNLPKFPIYLATREPSVLTGYRLKPLDGLQRVSKLTDKQLLNLKGATHFDASSIGDISREKCVAPE
ncbi:MAG: hypothetical protein HYR94_11840 [Chloroflexi bacterium]|nr:hypothetical protein [Chloroflexota bacterium]